MSVIGGGAVIFGFHIGPKPPGDNTVDIGSPPIRMWDYSMNTMRTISPQGRITKYGIWESLSPTGRVLSLALVFVAIIITLPCSMAFTKRARSFMGLLISIASPAIILSVLYLIVCIAAQASYGGSNSFSDFFRYGASVLTTGTALGIIPLALILRVLMRPHPHVLNKSDAPCESTEHTRDQL